MNIKVAFLSVACLSASVASNAQDKIYKRDGEVVDAKIKSVGTRTVIFQKYDNQSGPEYTLPKTDIEKIVYENGGKDDFEWAPRGHHHGHRNYADATEGERRKKIIYKPNLLAIAPLQFTENGLGFSVNYERALDKNGIVAFYMPAIMTFNLNSGTFYNSYTGTYTNNHQDIMYHFMPGIKLYPTGCYGYVKYSIGPSVVLGVGEKSSTATDPNGFPFEKTESHVLLGMVINNTLNINPSPHVYLGLELGFGFTYMNRIGGLNQGTNGIAQGGFKVGYRF